MSSTSSNSSKNDLLATLKKIGIVALATGAVVGGTLMWYWQFNYFALKKLPDYNPKAPLHQVNPADLPSQPLKINYRVINLDNALLFQEDTMKYMQEDGNLQVMPITDMGPALRMECSFTDWFEFERRVAKHAGDLTDDAICSTGPLITFYGSNDYHHLTLALVRRFRQPFNLIMFDNHPDWVEWYPGLHCGSWLNHACNLPTIMQAFHMGGYSGEFEDPDLRYFTPWKLLVGENPKIKVLPTCDTFKGNRWAEVPQQKLRFPRWDKETTKARLLELLEPYKETLKKYPLYITLDKDVMQRIYTLQNWNSGELTLDETLMIIETLIELSGGNLLAMDITGDFTKVETAGLYRAYLHSTQHEPSENNIPQEIATELNQKTNLKILKTIKQALQRARGQLPDEETPENNATSSS